MRVNKFLKEKNISLKTLNAISEYTHLNRFNANSKLSDETIHVINKTLSTSEFNDWLRIKFTYEKAKIDNAKNLTKNLTYGKKVGNTIVGITVSDDENNRILNALEYLIKIGFYNTEKKAFIENIIKSEKSITSKISQLKNYLHEKSKQRTNVRESHHDPYEGFEWGGLSGEEDYIGFWNTD
jgi:hypothetical protein